MVLGCVGEVGAAVGNETTLEEKSKGSKEEARWKGEQARDNKKEEQKNRKNTTKKQNVGSASNGNALVSATVARHDTQKHYNYSCQFRQHA